MIEELQQASGDSGAGVLAKIEQHFQETVRTLPLGAQAVGRVRPGVPHATSCWQIAIGMWSGGVWPVRRPYGC
ncbi:hypothetical protein ACH347_26740 [Saccharopolyspora sp. 5N102]|uniref:hypothetical protein n=1 Tax=Saccharopolyspora sp. 5N102 TaxID=3375155 RepID=UPI0037A623C8